MTRIERLLGAPSGSEVELPVDLIVTDDWTTPALEAPLRALGTERAAAPVVLVRDHTQPPESYEEADRERVVRLRTTEEEFVRRFGARRIARRGIQHHVLPATGLLRPGMVVLGNDSHTPTLGAYGLVAFAAQPTTIAAAIHTGKVVIRVPETLRIRVEGLLAPGVSARDAGLTLLRLLRDGGTVPRLATGRALEYCGPGLAPLSLSQRAVLANATPEAVAVTCTFPSNSDEDEEASPDELTLDLGAVTPSVARSGEPADVVRLEQFPQTRVDRVFVGTCAGGTYEEISDFAEALGERAAIPALVAPASAEVEARLREEGTLQRLESAGVTLLPPGCGPCFGFGVGRLSDGEVAVVTGNRNGVGRMGSPSASIHLASGRTAGLAAASGRLGTADPAGGSRESAADPTRHAAPSERRAAASKAARPKVIWPQGGNVIRLLGTVSTDDLTPSAVPGVGTSSDQDPNVLRRLLLYHLDCTAATRNLRGTVMVADENFGVGSNRASSVRALKAAGVRAVIARSVSPLYAMGARDEGLSVVTLTDESFYRLASAEATVEVDVDAGSVRLLEFSFPIAPSTPFESRIRSAGGIIPYLRSKSGLASNA